MCRDLLHFTVSVQRIHLTARASFGILITSGLVISRQWLQAYRFRYTLCIAWCGVAQRVTNLKLPARCQYQVFRVYDTHNAVSISNQQPPERSTLNRLRCQNYVNSGGCERKVVCSKANRQVTTDIDTFGVSAVVINYIYVICRQRQKEVQCIL